MEITAWVNYHLEPNVLLGTPWFHEHGVIIDVPEAILRMSSVPNVIIPITTEAKGVAIKRRVVVTRNTVVPPRSTFPIPVSYTNHPEWNNFGFKKTYSFTAAYEGPINARVNARTTKHILYFNESLKPIRLRSNLRMGHIENINIKNKKQVNCTTGTLLRGLANTKKAGGQPIYEFPLPKEKPNTSTKQTTNYKQGRERPKT
jgi:hypothetical protein